MKMDTAPPYSFDMNEFNNSQSESDFHNKYFIGEQSFAPVRGDSAQALPFLEELSKVDITSNSRDISERRKMRPSGFQEMNINTSFQ